MLSTNKGLCGGLNNNLFRKVIQWFDDTSNVQFISLGKKSEGFVARSGYQLSADFSSDNFLDAVSAITELFVSGFLKGELKSVFVAFNRFISSFKQEPVMVQILPLALTDPAIAANTDTNHARFAEFLIEPSMHEVLDALLPHYVEIQVRNAILEASASEHSARMMAMKNATDNANFLIDDLTVAYNRLRQEKITYEIADIVTAQM